MQQQQNCDDGEIEEDTGATRRFQEKKQSVNLNSLMAEIKCSSCEPRLKHHSTIIHVSSGRRTLQIICTIVLGVKSRAPQPSHQYLQEATIQYNTGCPILLDPLCFFFVISQVLEHVQRNFLPFFNCPGNLLHYSYKNFEN